MPLNACLLIKTKTFESDSILEKIARLKGVRKVFIAYGRFDLVAFVRAQDYFAIRKLSVSINSMDGVRSTETLVEA
ncbi:MAG: Lrp/AsnC ligand binding domain-containing protein [Nitrososphaerales archaeon]